MKIKILTLIAASAIVTLSFTFASVKDNHKKTNTKSSIDSNSKEPIGGFSSDEK